MWCALFRYVRQGGVEPFAVGHLFGVASVRGIILPCGKVGQTTFEKRIHIHVHAVRCAVEIIVVYDRFLVFQKEVAHCKHIDRTVVGIAEPTAEGRIDDAPFFQFFAICATDEMAVFELRRAHTHGVGGDADRRQTVCKGDGFQAAIERMAERFSECKMQNVEGVIR